MKLRERFVLRGSKITIDLAVPATRAYFTGRDIVGALVTGIPRLIVGISDPAVFDHVPSLDIVTGVTTAAPLLVSVSRKCQLITKLSPIYSWLPE